jgi:hypothetical protein
VRSRELSKKYANLVLWEKTHATEFQEEMNEWRLVGHRADILVTNPAAAKGGQIFSEFHAVVMVRRFYDWYMWNVFFFIVATVFMSWSVFLLGDGLGDGAINIRSELSLATVVVIFAIKFLVAGRIPPSRCATLLDKYCAFNCGVVTFAAFGSAATQTLGSSARQTDITVVAFLAFVWSSYHTYLYVFVIRAHFKARDSWAKKAMNAVEMERNLLSNKKTVQGNKQFLSVNGRKFELAKKGEGGENAPLVKIGYKIMEIGQIDLHRLTYSCNFRLVATWTDKKLANCSKERADQLFARRTHDISSPPGMKVADWEKEGLFQPDLTIMNSHDISVTYFEMKVTDLENGVVTWTQHCSGWLSMELYASTVRFFPFDYHELRICLRSHKFNQSKTVLELWGNRAETESQEMIDEWQLVGHRADSLLTDKGTSTTAKQYSEFHIVVMVQRHHNWYLTNTLYFAVAALYMGCSSYGTSTDRYKGWTEEAIFVLLGLVAGKYAIGASTPKVHYLTLHDGLLLWWFLMVVVAVVETGFLALSVDGSGSYNTVREVNGIFAGCMFLLNVVVHLLVLRSVMRHLRKRTKWSSLRISRKQTKRNLVQSSGASAKTSSAGRFRRHSLLRAGKHAVTAANLFGAKAESKKKTAAGAATIAASNNKLSQVQPASGIGK